MSVNTLHYQVGVPSIKDVNSIHSEPTFTLVLASFPDVWRPDSYKEKLKLGH